MPVATLNLETVPCNLCHSTDLETVYDARAHLEKDPELAVKFRASSDELLTQPLVKCRNCSLLFVNPRVRAAAILAGYAEGDDPQYVSQMNARVRTFAGALSHVNRLKPAKGRLLDVGTAAGAFLRTARDDGWEAMGIEPNRWLARWGRDEYGVPIQVGSIDDVSTPDGHFDVVTLWDVIEHTPDPLHVLRRTRQLLKDDGLLVVNFPDIGSWIARAMGRSWPFLSSVHLYYFTRDTMRATLQTAGFEIATVRPHVQRLELDYLLSRAAVVSPTLSRVGASVVRRVGLGACQVPYWMGQTWVAARVSMANARSTITSALLSLHLLLSGMELLILSGA
jgi:2-polyprenyl-3-methyl-5-hydroxy-6-metoxy-1,4-benzoquinol methylase